MATGDHTTLEAVKQQMETSSTSSDDLIETLITAASRAIDRHLGRVAVSTVANPASRLIDVGVYGELAHTTGIPIGDLAATPSAVVVRDANDAVVKTLVVADDVVALPLARQPWEPITRLRIRPGVICLNDTHLLQITGNWGWPEIPADFEQACIVTVRSWLRTDSASSGSYGFEDGRVVQTTPEGGWMLPMAAKQLLLPYRRIGIA